METDPERLRAVYERTDIRRLPITGIVAGYHTLPFTLVGPNDEPESAGKNPGSLKLTGKISVSPKLVIPVNPHDERFADIFPESAPFMDRSLVGRVFSFSMALRRNLQNLRVRNEDFSIEECPEPDAELVEKVLNELSRAETINRGLIWCPEPRFYPVSLERFIVSVL